jgi:dolichyl-phosphate beta-glucosyltransferase
MEQKKLLLIIPFYNEALRMAHNELAGVFETYPETDFLLVNDGSADDTPLLIDGYSTRFANVAALHLPHNGGKAQAIRQAVLTANPETHFYTGYMDADLATPAAELIKIKAYADAHPHYRFIMGSRIKKLGSTINRYAKRHYFGRVFATIVSKCILRAPVYDTQCGAKIMHTALARQLFAAPFITRWVFDVELLLRYKKQYSGLTGIYEYSLAEWTEKGHSKITFKDLLGFPWQLVKIYRAYV